MATNFVLTYEEKRNIQYGICDEIDTAKLKLQELKQFYSIFLLDLPMSSYTNFRDALFHYVKLYEHSDFSTVNGNVYTINEHLQRGVKDAVLRLINYIVKWLECFCVEHKLNETIKTFIDSEFPGFANTTLWSKELFKDVSDSLKKEFSINQNNTEKKNVSFSEKELNSNCLSYCADIIQTTNLSGILELRRYMHYFRTCSHRILHASFRQILPISALKKFAIRQYAFAFSPCPQ